MAAMLLLQKHTCWSAAVHYPFITTRLFLAQNRFDLNQCGAVMGVTRGVVVVWQGRRRRGGGRWRRGIHVTPE